MCKLLSFNVRHSGLVNLYASVGMHPLIPPTESASEVVGLRDEPIGFRDEMMTLPQKFFILGSRKSKRVFRCILPPIAIASGLYYVQVQASSTAFQSDIPG